MHADHHGSPAAGIDDQGDILRAATGLRRRDVAIALPEAGDLVLRRSLRTLVDVLTEPCGGAARSTPASDARTAALLGAGPLMPARAAVIAPRRASAASAWLFALTAMLLLAEMIVRPRARAA